MTDERTGGPAFPQHDDATGSSGMTLRDYFAAHAMQGLISAKRTESINDELLALSAWQIADEMLVQRG